MPFSYISPVRIDTVPGMRFVNHVCKYCSTVRSSDASCSCDRYVSNGVSNGLSTWHTSEGTEKV
jgi:hypothetical protein